MSVTNLKSYGEQYFMQLNIVSHLSNTVVARK